MSERLSELFERLMLKIVEPVVLAIEKETAELRSLRKLVARRLLPTPEPMTPILLREGAMGLVYTAELPPLPNPIRDIVKQFFKVTVGDNVILEKEYPVDGSVLKSDEFAVQEQDTVLLSCVYADDAVPPNLSIARTQTFTAHDTIAPDQPGEFGAVTLVREE